VSKRGSTDVFTQGLKYSRMAYTHTHAHRCYFTCVRDILHTVLAVDVVKVNELTVLCVCVCVCVCVCTYTVVAVDGIDVNELTVRGALSSGNILCVCYVMCGNLLYKAHGTFCRRCFRDGSAFDNAVAEWSS